MTRYKINGLSLNDLYGLDPVRDEDAWSIVEGIIEAKKNKDLNPSMVREGITTLIGYGISQDIFMRMKDVVTEKQRQEQTKQEEESEEYE